MFKMVKSFLKDEQGLETVEYAVMLALIVAALIAGAKMMGDNAATKFTAIANTIAQ